jgi:thiamine biosynthesis lipoprotein
VNRRRFLACAVGAGGVAALTDGLRDRLRRVEHRSWALGSQVTLTVLHEDSEVAERALTAAFAVLDDVEESLSLYRPQSAICRLNRLGVLERPPADLVTVLGAALEWSRMTSGAFDPTVQPFWALHAGGNQPGPLELEAARVRVDWRRVEVGSDRIRLGPGQAITLNGIAQGFAADRVREVLAAHGIRHALIDTGEVGGVGRKEGGEAWRVGIQHPRRAEASVALAEVADRVLATSGDYRTAFADDFSSHHIVDPATGESPEFLASVSVVASTGMEADALSTAVFVLGPERGLALAQARPGVEVLLVSKDGVVCSTPGFPRARV